MPINRHITEQKTTIESPTDLSIMDVATVATIAINMADIFSERFIDYVSKLSKNVIF